MSRKTDRADAKRERGKRRLEQAMQPYLRKGFVIRSQTDTMVSLTLQKRHGVLWRATVGGDKVHDAWKRPKKGIVVNLTVTRSGRVKASKSKQYL